MRPVPVLLRLWFCILAVPTPIVLNAENPADPVFEVDTRRPVVHLKVDTTDSPVPWNHLDFHNDPDNFQFAIVSDRTGGNRWGVFQEAIFKLNLLQPEFVMSVGDMIQGYTEDLEVLNGEWDEFTGFIDKLNAPFFYVPGNHDMTNPTMAALWKERFGADYYSFVYKDVLFLCLNSNDGATHQIREAQTAWAEQTLARHPGVRWTLVFVHRPFWDSVDPKDVANWVPIERALADRKYTVFAGHYHSYTKIIRNDRNHFTLATTGGTSGLRGPSFGEFDHVAWITMSDDGPIMANLMLDGIQDENIRTEDLRALSNTLRGNGRDHLRSELLTSDAIGSIERQIKVTNDLDVPLHYTAQVRTPRGIHLLTDPSIDFTIEPNSVVTWPLSIQGAGTVGGEILPVAEVDWTGQAMFETVSYDLAGTSILHAVRTQWIAKASGPITIDGKLDDWAELSISVDRPDQILIQPGAWRGPDDGRYRFDVAWGDEALFLAIEVFDDQVHAVPGVPPWIQDGIEVRIDAHQPPANRTNERKIIFVALSPGDHWEHGIPLIKEVHLPEGSRYACLATDTGYVAEIAIPSSVLDDLADGPWTSFRLNVQVDDTDPDEGTSQLNWKPDWRSPDNISQSGTFLRTVRDSD